VYSNFDHRTRRSRAGGTAPARAARRRGSVLVEFALVALVLYLILAGGAEMGRAVFSAQLVQDVARATARELALTPLPATMTFDEAMKDCRVRAKIFDERWLVIDLEDYPGRRLDELFARLPIANQLLRPLMIFDNPTIQGRERRLLRYPGALLFNTKSDPCNPQPAEFTVGIPLVTGRRGNQGWERIRWVPVLEEVRSDPDNRFSGPFSVIARGGEGRSPVETLKRGVVALRVNYPYQAAMLSGFRSPAGPFETNAKRVIAADDSRVIQENAPPGRFVKPPVIGAPGGGEEVGPYAGAFGLGRQLAFAKSVRPFRKLISGQAVFRRERYAVN